MNDTTDDNRVKEHFAKYKGYYISAGVGIAVGVGIGLGISNKTKIAQIVIGKNNVVTQSTVLIRRGHPGNVIRCIETGELFASQNRAAEAMGISASNLSQHLKGKQPSVNGFTFENLGEAK